MTKSELVEIVLENCEVYGFPKKDVSIELDGLGKVFYGDLELNQVQHCAIQFFDNLEKPLNVITYDESTEKDWWKRIKQNPDITQICINGQTYYVDWGGDGWNNAYQTNLEEDNGRKIVIISKTRKSLKDF